MTRSVLIVVPDLFFATRIREVAATIGVTVVETTPERAAETARSSAPALVIVDLQATPDAAGVVRALRQALPGAPIAAFHSHVDVAVRDAAIQAGADPVLPRSAFTRQLADMLAGR
jgi:DNA-binding NarL/FixJ family response regulator